jgi:hypothetical protein
MSPLAPFGVPREQGQSEAGIAQVRARAELWAQMVASLLPVFARKHGIVFTP